MKTIDLKNTGECNVYAFDLKKETLTFTTHDNVEVGDVLNNIKIFKSDIKIPTSVKVSEIIETRPARGGFENKRPTFYCVKVDATN